MYMRKKLGGFEKSICPVELEKSTAKIPILWKDIFPVNCLKGGGEGGSHAQKSWYEKIRDIRKYIF